MGLFPPPPHSQGLGYSLFDCEKNMYVHKEKDISSSQSVD